MSPLPEKFESWKRVLPEKPEAEQRLDQWIFIHAASVLLSNKTGELLNLSLNEMGMPSPEVESVLTQRAKDWGFQFEIFRMDDAFIKLIIYYTDRLEQDLSGCPSCILSGKLGYPTGMTPQSFLNIVKKRWNDSGEIPHEIGIALGYPIEDVFGYMGLMPLSCKGMCGWQVYGCMKESQRRSCQYQRARSQAIAFLAA